MKSADKIKSSPAPGTDARESENRRERIVNSEEQNDTGNRDGHHYDKHFEPEDPEEKAVKREPQPESEETETPKMKAEKKPEE